MGFKERVNAAIGRSSRLYNNSTFFWSDPYTSISIQIAAIKKPIQWINRNDGEIVAQTADFIVSKNTFDNMVHSDRYIHQNNELNIGIIKEDDGAFVTFWHIDNISSFEPATPDGSAIRLHATRKKREKK